MRLFRATPILLNDAYILANPAMQKQNDLIIACKVVAHYGDFQMYKPSTQMTPYSNNKFKAISNTKRIAV